MRKRITSLLLTLAMLLSLVPAMGVTASAAEPEWTIVNSFEALHTAVKNKQQYIQLGRDIDTSSLHDGLAMNTSDLLTFENQNFVLDLNGKTLHLEMKIANPCFIQVVDGSLTIKDSSDTKTGAITGLFGAVKGGWIDHLIFVGRNGSLTLEGGTFSVKGIPFSDVLNAVCCIDSSVTIKDGVKLIQPEYLGHCNNNIGDLKGQGYALYTEGNCKVIIDGGEFDGYVNLSGYQDTNGSVQINGGTFKQGVQVRYTAEENNSNPAVTVSGGTFEGDVYLQYWPWKTSLYMPYRLNGGTFKGTVDLYADGGIYEDNNPTVNPNIVRGLDQCFGYNAVVTPDDTFTGADASTAVLKKKTESGKSYKMLLEGTASNPVRIIPNAWGMMESVTLDGNKIDYAKDWNGTPVVIKNNEDHTITFKWKDLADELKTKGYRYDAQCMRYTSGDTTGLIPTDQIPTGTEYSFTIQKGKDPYVYSFDLRLDLKKGSNPVNTFANQHIVRLVVVEAPAADTRTPIDSVTLSVPKLTKGATSGADFTLSGTNTGVSSTVTTVWENIPTTGAVEGKFYVARITLTAEDGYAFNTKTQVNLNGDYSSKGSGINNGGAGMTVLVSVPVRHEHTFSGEWQNLNNDKEYHFKTCSCGAQTKEPHNLEYNETLDQYQCICGYWIKGKKTEIQFVAASPRSPIDGESPSNYTPEQWVHNIGKNYTVANIDWKDEAGHAVTTFKQGEIYTGTVTFKANDGFKFDKDRIQFNRIFDTSTTETVEGYSLDEGATTLIATFKLKDNTVRPGLQVKVELPTLSDKIGQNLPAAGLVDTTLPDDVELTTSVYENILDDEPITSPVESNKTYFYVVMLKLKDGSDVTKAYNVSYTVTDGGDAVYHTDNLAGYGVLARYQTPAAPDTSKINSVALTVTAPKYGDTPATTATGANDTLYTVDTPTWTPAETDGKFGANTYTVSIPVTAAEGYSFDANCVYTVNGYVATYAGGKVSYEFPALTAPHTHDYTGQPYLYLDPGNHYQVCKDEDGGHNIEAHTFGNWEKVDGDTHKATCSKCNYEQTANHSWNFVKEDAPTFDDAGTRHYKCSCGATKTESIPALTAISAVNVTVTAPVKGAAPGIATTADTTYNVAATDWDPTVSSTFAGGTEYTVKVSLKATDNNRFTNATTFQINGQQAKIVGTQPTAAGADNTVIALAFPATGGGSSSDGGGGGGAGVTTYAITVQNSKNGGVTASHKSAAKDTAVTLTVTPDKGYVLDTLTVLDSKNKAVKLTEKNGKYTFTMPAGKVTVSAAFKAAAPASENPFTDVPSGTSATTFNPDGSCTRAQAVTFLWRAAGSPEPKSAAMPFTDVPAGSYFEKAVLWAVENGITKGTSDTTFNPDASCTRAQIVTFLWRAGGSPAVSGNSAFSDVASDAYYAAAVAWAEKNGVTGGIGGGLFGSDNTCTRAQIVTFLHRAMK